MLSLALVRVTLHTLGRIHVFVEGNGMLSRLRAHSEGDETKYAEKGGSRTSPPLSLAMDTPDHEGSGKRDILAQRMDPRCASSSTSK